MLIGCMLAVALLQDVAEVRTMPGREVLELACLECHAGADAEAGFDLAGMLDHGTAHEQLYAWRRVGAVIETQSMPPRAEDRLEDDEAGDVMAFLQSIEGAAREHGGAAGHVPVRRLTRDELARSLRELLGVDVNVERLMPRELVAENGFETNAATLFVHPEWLQRADVVVREALRRASLDPATFDLPRFLRRAFRRPATAPEIVRYQSTRQAQIDAGKKPAEALRATLFEVLSSPHFRLRVEDALQEPGASSESQAVGAFGLASRISFLLWSAPPDDVLLDLAESGGLLKPEEVERQIARMLRDERALEFTRLFAGQWLGTRRLGHEIKPDPIDNPAMTDSVMRAMRDEVARFVLMLFRESRPLDDLLVSDESFVTQELAGFYELGGELSGEVDVTVRIQFTDPRRRGLLGKAAVLACTSYPDRTSPVLRGAWLLDDLLGTPPPPPPPGASEFAEETFEAAEDGDHAGARGLLELHRASRSCAACHDRIDPLGFALEGFDRFGRVRQAYGDGEPIDTGGKLPSGKAFSGPSGLARVLLADHRSELSRETARRLLRYGLGRPLDWRDERTVDELADVLGREGFGALLRALVASRPFRFRDPD